MKRSVLALLSVACLLVPVGRSAQAPDGPVFSGNGHMYAVVRADGNLSVWGRSAYMSFGDGRPKAEGRREGPVALEGIGPVRSAAFGSSHALLLMRDGTIRAWGENIDCTVGNDNPLKPDKRGGRLGPVNAPVPIGSVRNAIQIAASAKNSAALLADGTVLMWGSARTLMLGPSDLKEYECASFPRPVAGLAGVKQLAMADDHALALKNDGTVVAWGLGVDGQLGDGSGKDSLEPLPVQGIKNAVAVSAAHQFSVALLADGTVRTWGFAANGALGDPETKRLSMGGGVKPRLVPYAVPGVTGVKAIVTNGVTVIALLSDGSVRGWGEGYHGSLGNGASDAWYDRPQTVKLAGPVKSIYQAGRTAFAVQATGATWVWGPLNFGTAAGVKPHSAVPVAFQP